MQRAALSPAEVNVPTAATWFFAVSPDGDESMFRTLAEARSAARAGGGRGWLVEGRRVEVVD